MAGVGGGGDDDLLFGSSRVSCSAGQATATGNLLGGPVWQFDPLGGLAEEHVSSARLRSLILSKEKELHDINQFRIDSLEQVGPFRP